MKATRNGSKRFKVGDWVTFPFGARNALAQVIEARGPIGVNGRHLYTIRLLRKDAEPDCFELPGDELEKAAPPEANS